VPNFFDDVCNGEDGLSYVTMLLCTNHSRWVRILLPHTCLELNEILVVITGWRVADRIRHELRADNAVSIDRVSLLPQFEVQRDNQADGPFEKDFQANTSA
jgi:hypothetical protein